MVMATILSVILIIALIFSISVVIKKRRKAGVKGIKSALTPICLYLMAIMCLLAYWFNFLDIISWWINIILLILGDYFIKYISVSESKSYSICDVVENT